MCFSNWSAIKIPNPSCAVLIPGNGPGGEKGEGEKNKGTSEKDRARKRERIRNGKRISEH